MRAGAGIPPARRALIGSLLLGLLLGFGGPGWSVGPAGPTGWREYYSYHLGRGLHVTPRGLLLVCDQGILEHRWDGVQTRFSTARGLAGARIVAASYDASGGALVVAYADGVIDIAAPGERHTLTDLRDAASGSVPFPLLRCAVGSRASYYATSTHVLRVARGARARLDPLRVWRSDGAYALGIEDVSARGARVHVETRYGVYTAEDGGGVSLPALAVVPGGAIDARRVLQMADGTLFAWARRGAGLALLRHTGSGWEELAVGADDSACELTESGADLYATDGSRVWRVAPRGPAEVVWDDGAVAPGDRLWPRGAHGGEDGLYVASARRGLARVSGGHVTVLTPPSPGFSTCYRVIAGPSGPVFTAGGYGEDGAPLGRDFGLYDAGLGRDISLPGAHDAGVLVPLPEGGYLVGTSDRGLLEVVDGVVTRRHDAASTPLESVSGDGGAVVDALLAPDGVLWVLGLYGDRPLLRRDASGVWASYGLPAEISPKRGRLALSPTGTLWLLSPSTWRVLAMRPEKYVESNGREGYVTRSILHSGQTVECADIAFDRGGALWFATSRSVLSMAKPDGLLRGEDLSLQGITFHDPDWPVRAAHLLTDVHCTSVLADPGDGVWVGTADGAVYHTDPSHRSLVRRYHPHESALPGGAVRDMAFDGATGRVHVASGNGVISLLSEASGVSPSYSGVRVYPNPLRPGMENEVLIDGLKYGSVLKITDASGRLVRELHSLGGRAVWDTRNGVGRAVHSGVYLILISDRDGRETAVEKVAILR